LEKAEHRKQEQDILYERKLRKEREKEDHLYDDRDKFVTSSYKQKLMEQKKWLEEQEKKDAAHQDVTQQKNAMFNFYATLLEQKNVAAGSEDDAIKRERERKEEEEKKRREEEERRERERREKELEAKRIEKERIERSREIARDARKGRDGGRERETKSKDEHRHDTHEKGEKRRHEGAKEEKGGAKDKQEGEEPEKKKSKGAIIDLPFIERPKAVREAPKRNDAQAVLSAKERYLARKALAGQKP